MAVQTYLPGPTPDTVRTPSGRTLPVPVGWVLLPPGNAALTRREAEQAEYVEDFQAAVIAFLAFHGRHAELAQRLAKAVAEHATPVGSGTVARTKRIPIERRAEAAVIAWSSVFVT